MTKFSSRCVGLRFGEKFDVGFVEGFMRSVQCHVDFWVSTQHLL